MGSPKDLPLATYRVLFVLGTGPMAGVPSGERGKKHACPLTNSPSPRALEIAAPTS